MKIKRSKSLPAILLIYLAGISIYAWPGWNSAVSYTQYVITILVTLACIALLFYFLRKREKFREKNKASK